MLQLEWAFNAGQSVKAPPDGSSPCCWAPKKWVVSPKRWDDVLPKIFNDAARSNELDIWPENTGLHDSKKDGMMFRYPKKMGFQQKGDEIAWATATKFVAWFTTPKRVKNAKRLRKICIRHSPNKLTLRPEEDHVCIVVFHPNQSTSTAAQPPRQQRCHLPHPWAIRWWHLPRAGLLCLGQVELTFFCVEIWVPLKDAVQKSNHEVDHVYCQTISC